MFAALGSCASIEHIQEKSSACVEILHKFAHELSGWFHVRDFNRCHTQVSINSDIEALCLDLTIQNVHGFTRNSKIYIMGPMNSRSGKTKKAIQDVLMDGSRGCPKKKLSIPR